MRDDDDISFVILFRILSAYSMVGQGFEINSAVVALSTEPKLQAPFKKPVIIASNNLDPVEVSQSEEPTLLRDACPFKKPKKKIKDCKKGKI